MKLRKFGFALVCLLSLSCFVYLNYGIEQSLITENDSIEKVETNSRDNIFFAPDLQIVKSFFKVVETVVLPIGR